MTRYLLLLCLLFTGCKSVELPTKQQIALRIQTTQDALEAKKILVKGVDEELKRIGIIREALKNSESKELDIVKQRLRLARAIEKELKQLKKFLTTRSEFDKGRLKEFKSLNTQSQ